MVNLERSTKNNSVVLFTKKFPFGHQETYLFNELSYLELAFDKVIIVPYDEFVYLDNENRVCDNKNIEVYPINKRIEKLDRIQVLRREITVWKVLAFEILKGREPFNHLKYYKRNSSQIRHSFASAVVLNKYLTEMGVENVIFYNYWLHGGILISNFLNKLRKSSNINVKSRAHAYDVYHKDWYSIYPTSPYLFLAFETWKIHHTNKIATISNHGYKHFTKLYPKYSQKFLIARLGVKDNYLNDPPIKGDQLIWVTCSNIDENKRVFRIPELISKMNMDIKWYHFGKENSAEDKRKLEQEVSRYKMDDRCMIMGFKPNFEIIQFYQNNSVDLFLNLSQIEGIPVSLMEAASFGIPMVATNTVGNPEIVNKENGFLISVNFNTNDLANTLNEFFNNSELVAQKRRAARETFLDYYSAEKNYPEFINTILLN